MRGWLRFAASGPLTWTPSNATWTAWLSRQQRKRRREVDDAAQTANVTKEERSENQNNQRLRGRPGEGPALLYRGTGLCQEDRFQPRPISLADRGLARGAGRHGAATGTQQQPVGEGLPTGDIPARPTCGHVLHRRCAGRL